MTDDAPKPTYRKVEDLTCRSIHDADSPEERERHWRELEELSPHDYYMHMTGSSLNPHYCEPDPVDLWLGGAVGLAVLATAVVALTPLVASLF